MVRDVDLACVAFEFVAIALCELKTHTRNRLETNHASSLWRMCVCVWVCVCVPWLAGLCRCITSLGVIVTFCAHFAIVYHRTLKTGIFVAIVGLSYEPYAKLGTVAVLIPVLLFYNSLLVRFSSRPRALVYTVLGVYLALFVVLTLFLSLPVIGIENRQSDPRRVIGWIAYWVIESFASVCIPMLWSVVATIAPRKTASSLYTMLIISAQVGAISGSTMARQARRFSFQGLFMLEVYL